MRFGVLDQSVDLLFGKSYGGGNLYALFLAGDEVLGGNVYDTVSIDVEGDIDLRKPSRSWLNTPLSSSPS